MEPTTYTAFAGDKLLVSGTRDEMLAKVRKAASRGETAPILIFEDATGRQIDFDMRETAAGAAGTDVLKDARTGPGRPRLGVVSREVSLLPGHWAWLEQQSYGISGALRRLVDQAMKHEPEKERARLAREAVAKVMWVLAGNLPGFEEASRALYAEDRKRFDALIRPWPKDVRKHLARMLRAA